MHMAPSLLHVVSLVECFRREFDQEQILYLSSCALMVDVDS